MKQTVRILRLLFCLLVLACSGQAGTQAMQVHDSAGSPGNQAAMAARNSSRVQSVQSGDTRIASLEQMANRDPRAAYDLALRYFRGDGVGQDSYKALQWMRKSAEGGYLEAQKALGRVYLTGLEEMGSDPQEAEKWLRIAANRGDRDSAKLLEQATAARHKETEYFRWKKEQRELYYNFWHSGYPYRGHWRDGRWYY
jgi:TPR repeat protein